MNLPSVVALTFLLLPAAARAEDLPTALELQRRGMKNLASLATSNASWAKTELNEKGAGVRIDVIHSPEADRFDFSFVRAGKTVPVGFIIARKNVWLSKFAKEQVTRPYEAVLPLPSLYYYLSRVTPNPIRAVTDGIVLSADAGTITFMGAIAPDKKAMIDNARLDVLSRKDLDGGTESRLAAMAKFDALRQPFEIKVDRASGFEIESGTEKRRVITEEFGFVLEDVSFAFEELPASTKPPPAPTRAELGRSVLLAHLPNWKPGAPVGDLDLVLVDPKVSSVRRVPIRTGLSGAGTFVKDRTRVVVTASQPDGWIVPIEIDLATGANRRLAEDHLNGRLSLFPTASPNGSMVSVQASGPESILESQLHVIDLKSGTSKPIGEPFDQAFASWLPDGSGLLLLSRYPVEESREKHHVITRLGLNGVRTPILEDADHPVLLSDGKTILFQTRDSREWNTCDLTGKNVKRFGSGLNGYGVPTPSPDGKSLLMIKHDAAGAHPTVIRLADFSETPLVDLPGLWAYPSWR